MASSSYQPPPSSVPARTLTETGDVAELTYEAIDEGAVLRAVRDPGAGATCLFVGTTRDHFQGRAVSRLEYEAYSALAIKTLRDILHRARADPAPSISTITDPTAKAHCCPPPADPSTSSTPSLSASSSITKLYIVHRLGVVPVSESSIAIACSSPHRREAFAVAEWALEEVKRVVPIWKREVYADGNVIVARDGEAGQSEAVTTTTTATGSETAEGTRSNPEGDGGQPASTGVWKANFPR
ncbi:unnamed protein product [Tilletia controversa]|uniref:Uncharacterized protein n=3 Tax=Tilletia TaxID=13289 RepID=A0A8X7MVS9_9BASI|nr:hypothetical protein CF336_g2099 [Tilletia laevis]KAE8202795.1 hypothetical protein CF328_g2014 [Tilletia controversa]KAE8256621.1 hypothetical protein A4X03_0g5227 [Tilletia caries]KAE8207115.1 hypothetical protein CF335_g1387 [Tilletia laevis]KAE8252020.1 hypothetical protein A4X06_0g2441 [Tilletia controversa]